MDTWAGWAIGGGYALTSLKLLDIGLGKVAQPDTLAGLLQRVMPTRRVPWAPLTRLAGLVELVLFAALIVVTSASNAATWVAGSAMTYVVMVTPVGLHLMRRTGQCGCGGASFAVGHGASASMAIVGFLVRNSVMLLSLASYPAWGNAGGVAVTMLLVLGLWIVQLARSLHRARSLGIALSGRVITPREELVQLSEADVTGDDYFSKHLVVTTNGDSKVGIAG
jgi:hypothetical protein